jgi:hypothetical protein
VIDTKVIDENSNTPYIQLALYLSIHTIQYSLLLIRVSVATPHNLFHLQWLV